MISLTHLQSTKYILIWYICSKIKIYTASIYQQKTAQALFLIA